MQFQSVPTKAFFLPWKLRSYRLNFWCLKLPEMRRRIRDYPIFRLFRTFPQTFCHTWEYPKNLGRGSGIFGFLHTLQLSHHIDLECTGQRPWSSSPPGPSRPCGHNVPSETVRPPETPRPPETTGPSGPLGTPGALRIPGSPGPPSQEIP